MDSSLMEYDMQFWGSADYSVSLWTRLQETGRWFLSKVHEHVIHPVTGEGEDSAYDGHHSGGKMTRNALRRSSPYDRPYPAVPASSSRGHFLTDTSGYLRQAISTVASMVQPSGTLRAQPRPLYPPVYTVYFRLLDRPDDDLFCAQMEGNWSCETVSKYVAGWVGISDPTRIRLWIHDSITNKPRPHFLYSRACGLSFMLTHCHAAKKILYFEDLQPHAVEKRFLTVQVAFHHRNGKGVSVHFIKLREDEFTVKNITKALRSEITLYNKNAEIRLLEINGKKIKVFEYSEVINIEDYEKPDRSLHAEEDIEMEKDLRWGEFFLRILRYKSEKGKELKREEEEEILYICEQGDTFADVKCDLQNYFGLSKGDIKSSTFVFISPFESKELKDSDVLSDIFQKNLSKAWTECIQWEHRTEVPNQKRTRDEDDDSHITKKMKPGFRMTVPDPPEDSDRYDEEIDWSGGFGSPVQE